MTSPFVKLLVAAVALAVLAATPADAKRKHRKHVKSAPQASAQIARHRYPGSFAPGPVYSGNLYLGDDPDPFIRSQLLRDQSQLDGPE
jgi:hypothetical protein